MTKDQLILTIFRVVPYPVLIKDLDTSSEEDAIRFTWRDIRFRVDLNAETAEVGNGILSRTSHSILMAGVIKIASFIRTTDEE